MNSLWPMTWATTNWPYECHMMAWIFVDIFAGNGYMSDGTKPLFDVMVIFTRGQFWTSVNSGLNWPWTSPSFLIPKLIFLHCGGVHWDCETVTGLFQCCSGTVSQSLHQCTQRMHSQSGIGPLVLECLIWIKQNRHLDCFTVWLFLNMTMLCHILI